MKFFFLVLFSKNNKNPNFFNHHSCLGFVRALEALEEAVSRVCIFGLTFPVRFFISQSLPSSFLPSERTQKYGTKCVT